MTLKGKTVDPLKLIGTLVRVELNDSRILDGVIVVIDPFGSLLLSATWEYSSSLVVPDMLNKRQFGLVSVPKDCINKISIHKRDCAIFEDQ